MAACLGVWMGLMCLRPASAHAYHERGGEWMRGTAYTLGMGELSLGIIRWEAGVLDELTLGTSVLPWVVGPFFGSVVPNGYFKLRDWLHGRVAVAAGAQLLYLDASELLERTGTASGSSSSLLSFTGNAAGSVRWSDGFITSLDLNFTAADVSGDNEGVSFEGSAVLNNLQLAVLAQWTVTRVTALQLAGHLLLYREAPMLNVSFDADPRTHVDATLRANFVPPVGAWNLVPTVALSGKHVNFKIGVGYGHRWLPVLGLVFAPGVVLDLDFFVRF